MKKKDVLLEKWELAWDQACSLWGQYIKLSKPRFCFTKEEEKREGLSSSFAMIRFNDQAVVISLRKIELEKLSDYAIEILAHEIGHHIYCPADLTDHGKMIARIRKGLPGYPHLAPFISNLYSDLLINDKLKRDFNLRIDKIYSIISKDSKDELWTFYMRIYEILWGIEKGILAKGTISKTLEGDAQLGNRLIRNFSRDWLIGSGRFASLCLPYLMQNNGIESKKIMTGWLDSDSGGIGNNFPTGLTDLEDDELRESEHPALDETFDTSKKTQNTAQSKGQFREPFEYGEILKALGVKFTEEELKYRYYKEIASKYLVPFPTKIQSVSKDPILEGTDLWDISSPIENIDWFQTAMKSTIVIPGYTIVEQQYGYDKGSDPEIEPIDLDIYIDCSGSMPDPGRNLSYLALCGAIICLSALRTGSKVQATLWSGKNEFYSTRKFISDEKEIFKIITGYIGGATAFPIHLMRDTYKNQKSHSRKVHILHISDDGITTMFDKDEQGNDGKNVSTQCLQAAGGGGTFVLNLYQHYKLDPLLLFAESIGYEINTVTNWDGLLDFAKKFSQKNYGKSDA
jgi:hypothetical protein